LGSLLAPPRRLCRLNIPEADGPTYYNSLGVTGPDGYVMKYRKRLLYKTDKAYASPGTQPGVLETSSAVSAC